MTVLRRFALSCLLLLCVLSPAAAQTDSDANQQQSDVLQYLDGTIEWYRSIQSLRLGPDSAQESVILESVQRDALTILRQAFAYAMAEAAIIAPDQAEGVTPTGQPTHLAVFQKNIADNLAAVQKNLAQVNAQLATAKPAQREKLKQQQQTLQGALSLVQAQSDLIGQLKGFLSNKKSEDKSFAGAIRTLQESIPELNRQTSSPEEAKATNGGNNGAAALAAAVPGLSAVTAAAGNANNTAVARQTSGIIAAVSDFFPLWRRRSEIDTLVDQLNALEKTNEKLRTELRSQLEGDVAQGQAMAASAGVKLPPPPVPPGGAQPNTATPATSADNTNAPLTATPAGFDELTAQFRLLSAAVVPLGLQHQAMAAAHTDLANWRGTLTREFSASFVQLIIRIFILAVAITIPLCIAEIGRRATDRYIKDVRRRRQLRTVRRGVVGTVIAVVVVMSLFAEVGSLATYVGLLTAGVAVALQQVILSMFAYFFFFGRFGVRVGERVTIGATTGEVVEVGLLRVYVMEILDGKPSGRVAIFPNLVFFQPSAFFKQIADTNYAWHDMALLFAADTDQHKLRDALLAAAAPIYAQYQPDLRRQQAALESMAHIRIEAPKPDVTLQPNDKGLSATLRYPVAAGREDEIDQKMHDAVKQLIDGNPAFRLIEGHDPDAAA